MRSPIVISALLAVALYAVTLRGTWIFDDLDVARDDPRLHDVRQWPRYLTEGYSDGADHLWRPLTSLTFALQWKLTGERAWALHLINILLHAGATALVAALAWKLGGARCAWIAGPLFAAHPLHVEAVAYLVGRGETLAAIGILGALTLYIRPPAGRLTRLRIAGIFGCFLVAIFSKEQGLLLPAMMVAWTVLERSFGSVTGRGVFRGFGEIVRGADPAGTAPADRSARRALLLLITWTMAAYIVYREHILPWRWDTYFLDWTINPLVKSHAPDRWLLPVSILGRYASLLVLPWRLSPDYSASVYTEVFSIADPYFWIGLLALVSFAIAGCIALRRRSVPALFSLASLAIAYFLVSNIILIGTVFGERLMYLPSAFFILLCAIALASLPITAGRLTALMAFVLALTCWRTATYASRWNNALKFYEVSFDEQPRSVQLALLLGMELRKEHQFDAAARALARSRELTPGYWKTWYLSALVESERGKLEEAQRLLDRATEIDPTWATGLPLMAELKAKRAAATRTAS